MELEDVKKLAELARLDMDEEEIKEIAKDFDSILAYVGQVQEFSKIGKIEDPHENKDNYFLKNVMREDLVTNESGEYRENILKNMPEIENGYLKVKKIL